MPVLKNARQERFCQLVASGKTATAAYIEAGFAANDSNASRTRLLPKIDARIREILEAVGEKAEWTAADRLQSLKRIHDVSIKGRPRVAIAAIAEANKMQGSYPPQKHELTGADGGPIETKDASARDILADRLARLAAGDGTTEPAGGPDGSAG